MPPNFESIHKTLEKIFNQKTSSSYDLWRRREMSIVFIAVQCFQCDTMQVKQEKKSSNKWTCVVCNEKQSRRKVFARGYKAKELRKFVQSFNMSRGLAAEERELTAEENLSPIPEVNFEQSKKRTDWSEYLDLEENQYSNNISKVDEVGDEDSGIRIVTEMPKEMFKRPKLKNCIDNGDSCGSNSYRPAFSKRAKSQCAMSSTKSKDVNPGKWSYIMTGGDGKNESLSAKEISQTATVATKVSKWRDYLAEDDNDLRLAPEKNLGRGTEAYLDVWEVLCDDQKVEDDIHPDFL